METVNARTYTIEESSNVAQISYNDTFGYMEVIFQKGGHYRYSDVPRSVFDEALEAESIGKFVAKRMREFDYVCINHAQVN